MAAAAWKARKLNEILPALQTEFEEALSQGTILELETSGAWINDALEVEHV
jgi:hypothetical protein